MIAILFLTAECVNWRKDADIEKGSHKRHDRKENESLLRQINTNEEGLVFNSQILFMSLRQILDINVSAV